MVDSSLTSFFSLPIPFPLRLTHAKRNFKKNSAGPSYPIQQESCEVPSGSHPVAKDYTGSRRPGEQMVLSGELSPLLTTNLQAMSPNASTRTVYSCTLSVHESFTLDRVVKASFHEDAVRMSLDDGASPRTWATCGPEQSHTIPATVHCIRFQIIPGRFIAYGELQPDHDLAIELADTPYGDASIVPPFKIKVVTSIVRVFPVLCAFAFTFPTGARKR